MNESKSEYKKTVETSALTEQADEAELISFILADLSQRHHEVRPEFVPNAIPNATGIFKSAFMLFTFFSLLSNVNANTQAPKPHTKNRETKWINQVKVEVGQVNPFMPSMPATNNFFSKTTPGKKIENIQQKLPNLIDEVVVISKSLPPLESAFGVPRKQAEEMIRTALIDASKIINCEPAFQYRKQAGEKLHVDFSADRKYFKGIDHGLAAHFGGKRLIFSPKIPADTQKILSLVVNELQHFKITTIRKSFFSQTGSAEVDLSLPFNNDKERHQLELAIYKGMKKLWKSEVIKKLMVNENAVYFLLTIPNYKIKAIREFLKKLPKELSGQNRQLWDLMLESSKEAAKQLTDFNIYVNENLDTQLCECDSDIASLLTFLSPQEALEIFSEWQAYHQELVEKYLIAADKSPSKGYL